MAVKPGVLFFSGGFIAPFVTPELAWDFRLSRVYSINVSGHKYGLTYPGIGWAVWRGRDYLPEDLIFYVNYLGSNQVRNLWSHIYQLFSNILNIIGFVHF